MGDVQDGVTKAPAPSRWINQILPWERYKKLRQRNAYGRALKDVNKSPNIETFKEAIEKGVACYGKKKKQKKGYKGVDQYHRKQVKLILGDLRIRKKLKHFFVDERLNGSKWTNFYTVQLLWRHYTGHPLESLPSKLAGNSGKRVLTTLVI